MTAPRLQRATKIVREPDMRFPSSRIAVTPAVRAQLAMILTEAVAATVELRRQVERAHFSVLSPQLGSHHELFDRLAGDLAASADLLAVRCAMMGGHASTGLHAVGTLPPEGDDGEPYAVLAARYARYAEGLRVMVSVAAAADPMTADVLTEAVRGAEIDRWLLESHAVAARPTVHTDPHAGVS
jgi:DNA-binding ferritin-like protein